MGEMFLDDGDVRLYQGDVTDVLAGMPDESVDCVVTSPPYWGLRSYLNDDHEDKPQELGLEPTPDLYVERMVAVFRQIRRVLAAHGTCWVNLGDSYASAWACDRRNVVGAGSLEHGKREDRPNRLVGGLKEKDLVGIPWRVAFALQADGWTLRSDVVWSKPNPMPESVTDRPTKAHEMVFLLTKSPWVGRERGTIEARLSPEDARWAALLVDAEGNICVKRVAPTEGKSPQYGAQVAIGSTSRELLERLADFVGTGNINERAGTNAPMFYWQVSNKVAQDFLYAIYPHLIVKQRQAAIAIHLESLLYHRGNATRRTDKENAALESLWLRNKDCNQFGTPDLADVPLPKYGKWGASRYYFDQEAVREPHKWEHQGEYRTGARSKNGGSIENRVHGMGNTTGSFRAFPEGGRNVRSVWQIATQPYPEAHFATYPEELVRRCVLAGCPERVCRVCGKPSERIVEREQPPEPEHRQPTKRLEPGQAGNVGEGNMGFRASRLSGQEMNRWREENPGFESWSDCEHNDWRPGTVLDPFIGSGTTCKVARDHGRHSIGIDLSADYLNLAARRLQQLSLLT